MSYSYWRLWLITNKTDCCFWLLLRVSFSQVLYYNPSHILTYTCISCNQKRNFCWVRQKLQTFPFDHNCWMAHLLKRHMYPVVKISHFKCHVYMALPKVSDCYQWGEFDVFSRIQLKVWLWVHKNCWYISCKFQFFVKLQCKTVYACIYHLYLR